MFLRNAEPPPVLFNKRRSFSCLFYRTTLFSLHSRVSSTRCKPRDLFIVYKIEGSFLNLLLLCIFCRTPKSERNRRFIVQKNVMSFHPWWLLLSTLDLVVGPSRLNPFLKRTLPPMSKRWDTCHVFSQCFSFIREYFILCYTFLSFPK